MKDKFDDICTQLFLAIVFAPLGKSSSKKSPSYMKSQKPIDILSIIPLIKSGIPIRINREIEQSGYWDHPVDFIKPNDVELQFIDFFDFDTLGVREFEYYLVHIKKSNIDPSLKGRNGLVKVNHAKVILI
ncbi:MAG: hypothetical protein GY730_11950 [bacterium]|nr:hypothetical protein [bacterium]